MRKLFLGIGVLLVAVFIFSVFFLKVRSVTCELTSESPCPPAIFTSVMKFEGKPLAASVRQISSFLQNSSLVQSFSVKVSPLGDVSLFVAVRLPDIALKSDNNSSYNLYTKEGVFVQTVESTNLPTIVVKDQISSEEVQFVSVLGYSLMKNLPISLMSVSNETLQVTLLDQKMLFYPLSGDIDVLLGSTILTFSQLNQTFGVLIIKGEPVTVTQIDFRFKNPVLR